MSFLLILAFLFCVGSLAGWILELFFRHFYMKFQGKNEWINPGFLNGPYLPLYGFGLCVLYLLAGLEKYIPFENAVINKIFLFVIMAVFMTVLEYIAGIIFIKRMKVKLWDYTDMWGNIQGIVCPLFSFLWAILGAVYYFLIHPYIINALNWLSQNLAFSFFIGMFFGIILIDVFYSMNLVVKIKKFAKENNIVVIYDEIRENIKRSKERNKRKLNFLFALYSERQLTELLKEYLEKDLAERLRKTIRDRKK